ncbi:MAG: hypothetical protein WEB90_05310 [Gemmatimonadota bacterium]
MPLPLRAKGTLAFRFDVDSVRCLEEGVPRLMELARARGVRFSFFVNMGRSFNWAHNFRHFVVSGHGRTSAVPGPRPPSLPTKVKLGRVGVLKTMFLNPRLGDRYRPILDALYAEGHELALHGGTDHVIWQRSLATLSRHQIDDLLRPAYETFSSRYGAPKGFASPGFVHNAHVYELLDAYGFVYSSDETGEYPFQPKDGDRTYRHFQVPVNVMGDGNVPLIEQQLARGEREADIVASCAERIAGRSFALMYGHPYVEGVRSSILASVIDAVAHTHQVVTVGEYLEQWRHVDVR